MASRNRRVAVMLMASSMHGGGSEHQTALLLQHLDRERFEPHLFLLRREGHGLATLPNDVPVHTLPDHAIESSGWPIPGAALRKQARAFRDLVRSKSIDVIYDRTFHMTLIAGHRSASNSIPRVSTLVSPPHLALPSVEQRFVGLKRRRLAGAYRNSHCVIAVSEAVKNSAAQYYGLDAQQIATIPNPVDAEMLRQAASEDMKGTKSRDQTTTRRLVCVGRMSEEKGHRDLIEGIIALDRRLSQVASPDSKQAPVLELRLVGDGPLRSELESRWQHHSQQAASRATQHVRVTFCGHVQPALSEMAAADALILPSHFEGMPNVVLEAMALERNVIATHTGGTVELQHSSDLPTCYWMPPSDPVGLCGAIETWLSDEPGWQERIANANEVLRTNHALKKSVAAIEQRLLEASEWV